MGEDPSQPLTITLTLNVTLTLTPNRSQNGPELALNAAAPRFHRTRKFLNCGRHFRTADRATQFASHKYPPNDPFSQVAE